MTRRERQTGLVMGFDKTFSLLSRLIGGSSATFADDDPRTISTALLLRVAEADGVVAASENAVILNVIRRDFGLSARAANALALAGDKLAAETDDIALLVEQANRGLDAPGRLHLLDRLWQVTVVDDRVHEFEDNLVWRISDLLGVPVHERLAARQRAGKARQPR
ncbi:TerB family tellurite resistance protein [Candidatus Raskinella chloraquaticus]